jgi:pseudouridine synthase
MQERLQKLIAAAGIASRRHAEQMITAGQVSINGKVVTELGVKADPNSDHIKVRGKLINPLIKQREKVYVLLNKPKGYLTSVSDDRGRPVVLELLPRSLGMVHPVGRLDFNTEGLLLLTNDGEFTNYITAARNNVQKIYEVKVKGIPPEDAIDRLRHGVVLDDGARTSPAQIKKTKETGNNTWFDVILHQGRNQQIRRMFNLIGYSVVKLRRVQIGSLHDDRLPSGQWRLLTSAEVNRFFKDQPRERRQRPAKGRDAGAVRKPR